MSELPSTMLQMQSTVRDDGTLELALESVPVPEPQDDEVLIRVGAAPINPSDLGLLFGTADVGTIRVTGTAERPAVTADIPEKLRRAMAARSGQALPAGNEGAGEVVATGSAPEAQALLGRTVAILGGAMYAQYRAMKAKECLALPEGTTAVQGASCFVNPLTALGMVETMRLEGHSGLVHTAAASNLGQMLNRICLNDGVPLINIVRREEQAALLREQGATHVCDSSASTFRDDLIAALVDTGATLAFDATGGGELAGQILSCMEAAALKTAKGYSRYGSTVHKQVYIYGGLDRGPTVLHRDFGMAWGLGGWLLPPFLQRIGPEAAQKLRERVAAEITTTFASRYTEEVPLAGALDPQAIAVYARQSTGAKYLIRPDLETSA